jgi:hypothetical protein
METIEVPWMRLQHLAIERLGLGQPARLVQGYRLPELGHESGRHCRSGRPRVARQGGTTATGIEM